MVRDGGTRKWAILTFKEKSVTSNSSNFDSNNGLKLWQAFAGKVLHEKRNNAISTFQKQTYNKENVKYILPVRKEIPGNQPAGPDSNMA